MAVDIGLYISGSITVAAGVGEQRTIKFFSHKKSGQMRVGLTLGFRKTTVN